MKKILVTGASGFIAKHVIADLYNRDYMVRGTVRDLRYSDTIKSDIEAHLGKDIDIEFAEANLNSDIGWSDAASGCDAIMHTASPFPLNHSGDEQDLIRPAKEGTLRVLEAAAKNSINRVVLTSSNAAVYAGNRHISEFNEDIWSNIDVKGMRAYTKSKTIAERAAWDFVRENESIQLTTVNPVLVWGPGIGDHLRSASLTLFKMLMNKEMPMVPNMKVPVVDVRDVSLAHVNALENEDSFGKRYLVCEGAYWMIDVCKKMQEIGIDAPTRVAPSLIIRLMSLFDKKLKDTVPFLDYEYTIDCTRSRQTLGFNPISLDQSVRDTHVYLNSLIEG